VANTLAIETAFRVISIALDVDGRIFVPATDLSRGRGSALHPALEELLKTSKLGARDLDEILVDVGPGSYTGLRFGLALARTMHELTAVAITETFSTDQLAWHGRPGLEPGDEVAVAMDARRNQWYVARYRLGDALERLAAPACVPTTELGRHLAGVQRVFSTSDALPVEADLVTLDSPPATGLFELRALGTPTESPEPVYLMPPL